MEYLLPEPATPNLQRKTVRGAGPVQIDAHQHGDHVCSPARGNAFHFLSYCLLSGYREVETASIGFLLLYCIIYTNAVKKSPFPLKVKGE